MIMPGGADRAQNIVNGMQDAEPNFDERGQVAIDVQLMYGFVKVYSAKWNEFTPSAEGTKTVSTNLGEGYTATVADDGRILVRESGTEPVIRVMVEAATDELCEKYVTQVIDVIEKEGLIVE